MWRTTAKPCISRTAAEPLHLYCMLGMLLLDSNVSHSRTHRAVSAMHSAGSAPVWRGAQTRAQSASAFLAAAAVDISRKTVRALPAMHFSQDRSSPVDRWTWALPAQSPAAASAAAVRAPPPAPGTPAWPAGPGQPVQHIKDPAGMLCKGHQQHVDISIPCVVSVSKWSG
jgi:hypothetical protein